MSRWRGWFRPRYGQWRAVSEGDTFDEARAGLVRLELAGDCAVMLAGSSPHDCRTDQPRRLLVKARRLLPLLGSVGRTVQELAREREINASDAARQLCALEAAGLAARTRKTTRGGRRPDLWTRVEGVGP